MILQHKSLKLFQTLCPNCLKNTQTTSLSAVFSFFKSCQFTIISYDASDIKWVNFTRCFAVNIAKSLKTSILKNICEQLYLKYASENIGSKWVNKFHESRVMFKLFDVFNNSINFQTICHDFVVDIWNKVWTVKFKLWLNSLMHNIPKWLDTL